MSHDSPSFAVQTVMAEDLPRSVVDAIVALAEPELGPGYLDQHQLLAANHRAPAVAYAVDTSGHLRGFAVSRLMEALVIKLEHPAAREALAAFMWFMGLVETVVVSPDTRRQGLGERLVRAALTDALPPPSFCPLLLPAWRHPDGRVPAERLALRLGFRPLAIVPDYWFADSQARGYQCPVCGNPCHCAANLYLLSDSQPPSLRT